MLYQEEDILKYHFDGEELWIQAWGPHALRIRSSKQPEMPTNSWALDTRPPIETPVISIRENAASLMNGNIKASITASGKISVHNDKTETCLLEEFWRSRRDLTDPKRSPLMIEGRTWQPIVGGDHRLTLRFESLDPEEKIFGMGQYQQPYLNLKGVELEMAQRNTQATVPFAVSSRGYGFLWNNPSIGRATFGKNVTLFEALSTKALDYWIVAGDTPAEIVEAFASVTGTVPMMPEFGLGFWQCKLRYQSQNEVLDVAREHKRRNLPIDVIVIDYFHWTRQGEWKFDLEFFPDPAGMVKELKEMGIELMISVWPTVDIKSENFQAMLESGLLVRTERGIRNTLNIRGETVHWDATNPKARAYLWDKIRSNYYSQGIRIFWLDEAEPEYASHDFDNYRYYLGPDIAIGNVYPREYLKAFYEGMKASGQEKIINLVRCAWVGSQKYGALVWSGDIESSWSAFRDQLAAGLNMGLAGIPWWTSDIGGFYSGDPNDEAFRELFVRWFQWGTFCPVMRMHGCREPRGKPTGLTGGASCPSGAANEVWAFGDTVYDICVKYMHVRERLRSYTRSLMKAAHERGTPVMRPCFYDFPGDKSCWEITDQYMYGPQYLCCPIMNPSQNRRRVYLPPEAHWSAFETGELHRGGQYIEIDCPLDMIPVFERRA